jgi:auxin efflux carrier family protein
MPPAEPQQQFRHNTHDSQFDQEHTDEQHEHHNEQPGEEELDERTSLLPNPVQKARHNINNTVHHLFLFFPPRVRQGIDAIDSPFLDVAFLCTAAGVVLGLVPKLHRAFFAPYEQGGIFNAWLVTSIQNIGTLFTSLQVFLVGCKLGVGFERMKRSGDSGRVPIRAVLVVFLVRLVLWPVCATPFSCLSPSHLKMS